MVPDYALIGEIMFFAYGFEYARECGAKMVTTFKLCSEQLSAQPHYDYGMRAVKTVITAAGNLKRQEPDADEMVLLLRALQDVNIPKFLEMDLPLFEGIISDLFPGKKRPDLDYGALMRTMKEEIHKFGLQPVKFFITKVIQLYEMIIVRHGLMLVGPTGGGKSCNLHVLEETLEMTMMFEVEDLTVASPATVSRVGIIYMEPKGLGLDVLLQSWLQRMPPCTPDIVKSKLTYYFDLYVPPSLMFIRTNVKELVPTVDNNLTESLLRILDCYLEPYYPVEGRPPATDLMIADLITCIDPLFIFALIWSVGATTNEDGRRMFDAFLRQELFANKFSWPFPKGGSVYDFIFIIETKKWTKWIDIIEKYEVDAKLSFSEIIVPTTDSVRNTYFLDLLLSNDKHTLMVGATGTGKTININQYLMGASKVQGRSIRANVIPLTLTFSANTSANMTQDLLDSKMDKRRKGVYGPAAGKKFYIFVDDLNMPKREEYGAQPPIELLRQWFDQDGWYDRKDLSFRKLIDLTFVASMGPPGGGRQEVTARFLRHFNIIGYVEMSDSSKALIFGSILRGFLQNFENNLILMTDDIIINERMVEDINNILNSGDVANLYAPEDLESIAQVCRIECQKKKIPPTKLNIFAQYLLRVRKNIHLCVAMSPLGEAFRNRLRNFPSLVNCCTIDWFTNWPAEALQSVGLSILRTSDLGLGVHENQTVEMFKQIHMSVEQQSVAFFNTLRRRNYVTPTSYLELLSSFGKLIGMKRAEISTKKDRLQIGLDKLSETKKMVSVMQEELVILQPQLVKTQAEVSSMMVDIERDKASAAVTKAHVEVEEAKANEKAADAKAIADDAQKDLAEALPALAEATKCLEELKKSDIDEVKSLKTPPSGVVLTMKVVCLMFDVKPIKKNDPNKPGAKIDDYWEAGQKSLLTDAKAFLNSLFVFDKDNIPDRIIKAISPIIDDPSFTPQAIERSSKACTAICMWARAMHKYHFVALGVAPKRAKLKEAEDELAIVMAQLATAKATLQEVNDRLAQLEFDYNAAVEKKNQLEAKEASCKVQLSNADKLIGGLGGEETRWTETVAVLSEAFNNILGDVIISAATISYLGPFTSEFRNSMVTGWQQSLQDFKLPHTKGCNLEVTLANPVKLRSWQVCNLPSDSLSTQNALIMDHGRRWPLLIDPQGQGNRYVRSMAKDPTFAPNGMDVVKLTDKNVLRTLENGVQFGRWVLLENIQETLDAAIEPILLQQTFKQGGQDMMKLGDNVIPYNNLFRFFLTTKLANPHYAPEVQVKVSLLNFTITLGGLEEQLLGVVVAEELP
eukprot:gene32177-38921_t